MGDSNKLTLTRKISILTKEKPGIVRRVRSKNIHEDFIINGYSCEGIIYPGIQNVQQTIMEESICEEIDQNFIPDFSMDGNIFGAVERGTADNNNEQGVSFMETESVDITTLFKEDLKDQ